MDDIEQQNTFLGQTNGPMSKIPRIRTGTSSYPSTGGEWFCKMSTYD